MDYSFYHLVFVFGGLILPTFILAEVFHRIGKSRWLGFLWWVPVINIVAVVMALSKLFGRRKHSS